MALLLGGFLWWTLALIIWIAIAFWPARVADARAMASSGSFF